MSRAFVFSLGVAADAALGDPPTSARPVGLVRLAASALQSRAPRGGDARRSFGTAVALGLPAAAALLTSATARLAGRRRSIARLAAEASLLSTTLSLRTLLKRASEVEATLDRGELDEARRLTGRPQTFDREREFDRLAQHVRSHLDMERVRAKIWPG